MYIVGIDPGVNGYVAVVKESVAFKSTHVGEWDLFKMPIKKDDEKNIIDVIKLRERIGDKPAKVFIEQPPMMRIPGIKSLMTISENYGRILGVLEMEQYAYSTVLPSRWQAFLLSKAGMKKEKGLRGKMMALEIVRKLFPHESTFKEAKVHDGLVDAVLMAKYGSYVCGP